MLYICAKNTHRAEFKISPFLTDRWTNLITYDLNLGKGTEILKSKTLSVSIVKTFKNQMLGFLMFVCLFQLLSSTKTDRGLESDSGVKE